MPASGCGGEGPQLAGELVGQPDVVGVEKATNARARGEAEVPRRAHAAVLVAGMLRDSGRGRGARGVRAGERGAASVEPSSTSSSSQSSQVCARTLAMASRSQRSASRKMVMAVTSGPREVCLRPTRSRGQPPSRCAGEVSPSQSRTWKRGSWKRSVPRADRAREVGARAREAEPRGRGRPCRRRSRSAGRTGRRSRPDGRPSERLQVGARAFTISSCCCVARPASDSVGCVRVWTADVDEPVARELGAAHLGARATSGRVAPSPGRRARPGADALAASSSGKSSVVELAVGAWRAVGWPSPHGSHPGRPRPRRPSSRRRQLPARSRDAAGHSQRSVAGSVRSSSSSLRQLVPPEPRVAPERAGGDEDGGRERRGARAAAAPRSRLSA